MFSINVDHAIGLVQVKLSGLMASEEVAAYVGQVRRAFATNGLRDYAMVIDISDCPIQTQDTIKSMAEHMAAMPKARALAIVTGSSLARMQVRRLFKQPYARITTTIAEGCDWVLRGIEPGAA